MLAEFGDVTTIGFGPRPELAAEHIELDRSLKSLPQTVGGVLKLALRRFKAAELAAPATRAALRELDGRTFDLVVANEARALPLAFEVAQGAPVWGDMHEWAPGERTQILSWRLLVAPFMKHICAKYLPRAGAVTTVNESIARLYDDTFGCSTEVVRNANSFYDLQPTPVADDKIRLVHSGAAISGRNIENLITATIDAGERFTLDLYLMKGGDGGKYWEELRQLANTSSRVRFRDPVSPEDLPTTLNQYDLGIHVFRPKTANLPNKFFDFVQARLGLVFGPSPETDAIIRRHEVGVITEDVTVESIVAALNSLTPQTVGELKENAHRAAERLSSISDEATQRQLITRLLARSD